MPGMNGGAPGMNGINKPNPYVEVDRKSAPQDLGGVVPTNGEVTYSCISYTSEDSDE